MRLMTFAAIAAATVAAGTVYLALSAPAVAETASIGFRLAWDLR